MRYRRLIANGISLALLCSMSISAPVMAADPYEITAILSLTGVGAFLGKGTAQGLQALEAYVNKTGGIGGRPLKFNVEDDQTNPQVAVQLANAAIAKKPAVIIGGAFGAVCGAIAPLVKDGPVDYCMSPVIQPPPGSYVFSASVGMDNVLGAAVKYLRAMGLTRIAAIVTTDASGQAAEHAMGTAFASGGSELVAIEHFNPADLSVAAQLARIKAANPQALIAWATGTPAATVFRGLSEADLDVPVLTSNGNSTYAQMKQYAAFLPKLLLFPDLMMQATDRITDKRTLDAEATFKSAMGAIGIKPDQIQGTPWDPALLIVAALRKLGPNAAAAQLRDYLAGMHDFIGIDGAYDFRSYPQRGLGANAIVIVRWDPAKGDWVSVSKPGGVPFK
jgi:branched-chain amino acid transport system substrate-binding protein